MILGDDPAGYGFILRRLVLVDLAEHAPPPLQLGGVGLKISEKSLLGGRSKILILLGDYIVGGWGWGWGWSPNFAVKIKTA